MVKLTNKLLSKTLLLIKTKTAGLKNKSDEEIIQNITHLQLQNQFIDQIEDIFEFPNVTTLYLQNNRLTYIENLQKFPQLTHLYLQRNNISQLHGLNDLRNLKKLYLGYNEIPVVENLENLTQLEELHLEHQNLPLGEMLYFDPRSASILKNTLEILNISGNNLCSINFLKDFHNLRTLSAADNHIDDIKEVSDVVSSLFQLNRLDLSGNPVTVDRNFRNSLLTVANNLQWLDDKEITQVQRDFVKRMSKAINSIKIKCDSKAGGDVTASAFQFVHFDENLTEKPDSYPAWPLRNNLNARRRSKTK